MITTIKDRKIQGRVRVHVSRPGVVGVYAGPKHLIPVKITPNADLRIMHEDRAA